MQILRLAAAALNQTPLDWTGNRQRILAAIEAARTAGATVLCLPELCISGYGCEDQFFSTGVQKAALASLAEIAPATRGMVVALGMPVMVNRGIYNAAPLLCDGKLLGMTLKQHLAGDGIHYEPRWFRKWPAGAMARTQINGEDIPVGDLLYDCGGVRFGIEICRDAWVADRPGERLAAAGADILLNPTASHFAFGKQDIRRRLVLEGSRTMDVGFVFANVLGNEAGRAIFDGSTMIAANGKMIAEGPRLSFRDHVLIHGDVDVDAIRRIKASSSEPPLPPQAFTGETVSCEIPLPRREGQGEGFIHSGARTLGFHTAPAPQVRIPHSPFLIPHSSPWDASPPPKHEEFTRATALALFDYLRKSRTPRAVISLSGGADSAAVATLVWLMVKLGVNELGRESFESKLNGSSTSRDETSSTVNIDTTSTDHRSPITDHPNADVALLLRFILSCVYQQTRNSTKTTRHAAATIAHAIGAEFLEWNIDSLVDGYVSTVSQAIGRDLNWSTDDIALQNIQARTRGPAAWLLANLNNALLLVTSNRSEAAVGYATMDGDTCGGLAPIGGVDKHYLLQWLRWMEITGPHGIGPLPELSVINVQRPTAELRPSVPGQEAQTDEGDLMPYVVLDAIERAAVRDKLTPAEVFETIRPQFHDASVDELVAWIERFFILWRRNQWKRERYAPSFHLDDRGLDPKGWCRFPILSGNLEEDFAALRTAANQ